jgi:hypothetical protein
MTKTIRMNKTETDDRSWRERNRSLKTESDARGSASMVRRLVLCLHMVLQDLWRRSVHSPAPYQQSCLLFWNSHHVDRNAGSATARDSRPMRGKSKLPRHDHSVSMLPFLQGELSWMVGQRILGAEFQPHTGTMVINLKLEKGAMFIEPVITNLDCCGLLIAREPTMD